MRKKSKMTRKEKGKKGKREEGEGGYGSLLKEIRQRLTYTDM